MNTKELRMSGKCPECKNEDLFEQHDGTWYCNVCQTVYQPHTPINVSDFKNILFVCECNLNRSPAFEEWFIKNRPQYNVKSAGTSYSYNNKLTNELLEWANVIYVMDIEQYMAIYRRFHFYIDKVEIIGVSDGSPNLGRIIEFWVQLKSL